MSIQGLASRTNKDYVPTPEEEARFCGASGNAALQQIAREAHDVKLEEALSKGDTRSYAEFKDESARDARQALGDKVVHEALEYPKVGLAEKALHSVIGKLAPVAAGTLHGVQWSLELVGYYGDRGEAGGHALVKERAQAALVTTLRLPDGFRDSELQRNKHGVAQTSKGTNGVFMAKLHDDEHKGAVRLLQFHADRGAMAAFSMLERGVSERDYLGSNQEMAKAYKTDLAFKTGFDAATWAKRNSPSDFEAFKSDVASRVVVPNAAVCKRG